LLQQQTYEDSGQQPFLGISIGCNKGEDAIKLARMGTGSAEYDVDSWLDSVTASLSQNLTSKKEIDQNFVCGRTKNKDSDLSGTRRVGEVHCVEPMPSNFAMLQDSSEKKRTLREKWLVFDSRRGLVGRRDNQVPRCEARSGILWNA
jgi:hypothetical protein